MRDGGGTETSERESDVAAPLAPDAWDGDELLAALTAAVGHVAAHVDEIDRLNVFPVPDGDTGSNMLATLRAALDAAREVPVGERTAGAVAAGASRGALVGARGNSGVILSQVLRGIADALRDRADVDGAAMAEALRCGSETAYSALATPVEGTMLSVARVAGDAAAARARDGGDLAAVLDAAVEAAELAVAATRTQLPVLREAGVVDAGGQGIFRMLQGALRHHRHEGTGEDPSLLGDRGRPPAGGVWPGSATAGRDGTYGYETMFLLRAGDEPLDLDALRRQLAALGDSVLVAGDSDAARVHVHNARPDLVLGEAFRVGRPTMISVEGLDADAHEAASPRDRAAASGAAVVAVSPGPGFTRIFEALGAAAVVHGGDGADPSSGDLVSAVDRIGAREVVLLPNDPDVRVAAERAALLARDASITVVPTRSAAEGIAALLAVDDGVPANERPGRMERAARTIRTLRVTGDGGDAGVDDGQGVPGLTRVIDHDGRVVAAGDETAAAVVDAIRGLGPGSELVTLYRGADVTEAEADSLAEVLRRALVGIEVEVVDGGQPHDRYLIAVE